MQPHSIAYKLISQSAYSELSHTDFFRMHRLHKISLKRNTQHPIVHKYRDVELFKRLCLMTLIIINNIPVAHSKVWCAIVKFIEWFNICRIVITVCSRMSFFSVCSFSIFGISRSWKQNATFLYHEILLSQLGPPVIFLLNYFRIRCYFPPP